MSQAASSIARIVTQSAAERTHGAGIAPLNSRQVRAIKNRRTARGLLCQRGGDQGEGGVQVRGVVEAADDPVRHSGHHDEVGN